MDLESSQQPFKRQAPNSFFQVVTYSAHHSNAHTVSAHLHVSSTVHTIVLYLAYSSAPHASPSKPAIAVAVPGPASRRPPLALSATDVSFARRSVRSNCIAFSANSKTLCYDGPVLS